MPHLIRLARPCCLALILCCALSPTITSAVEPSIRSVDIRGLTIGGTTTLTVDGDDLGSVVTTDAKDPKKKIVGPGPRLILPFPAKQELKAGATEKRVVFDVMLPDDVAPGYYNLRLTTDGGVSLPVVIAVDRLPQKPMPPTPPAVPSPAQPVAAPLSLPIALHGIGSGSSVLEASFTGKAGQPFTAEIESQRLGGKLRPVVHLYDAKRTQLAWAWPSSSLAGDTRLTAVLPNDGVYKVTVHDLEYAAPASSYFRLRLGRWSSADRVFPPVVKAGGKATFELVGASPVERVDMASPAGAATMQMPAPKTGLWSGPRPFVQISPSAEFVEEAVVAGGKRQELPAGAVGVSGRLLKPYDEDRYVVAAAPGTKLRLEVFAERLGSAIDTAIIIRGDKDAILARGEDGPGTIDPTLEYLVPAGITSLTVGIVDALGRGGDDAFYRLAIEPATGGPGDFRLSTTTQRLSLPAGGRAVVPVIAERRGYSGEIALAAQSLPGGIKFEATKIPADADGALVTVERTGPLADAALTEWQGRAATTSSTATRAVAGELVRPVILKGHPAERLQPWLASELALAPTTANASDLKITWGKIPADARLVPGKNLPLPVEIARADDKLPVRLSLLTSQLPPVLANNQPDLPKTLRAEKPIELAAKAATGELVAVVPAELTNPTYDVTVQAELLSADKRTVLATAFAPVKRLTLSLPIVVKLDGPTELSAALDPKSNAVLTLTGKIERREGATGDATVSLVGLPAGINVAPATVKAGADDFTLIVAVPPSTPPGKLTGLKLSALIVPDPKQAAVRVKSRDVELTIAVTAPKATEPPKVAPPKAAPRK